MRVFETTDEDLDTTQLRKLDYTCRKLRLRPGERLLGIGCGWRGLIIHAAQQYGVEALGITLSRNQADLANERIVERGLQERLANQTGESVFLNPIANGKEEPYHGVGKGGQLRVALGGSA